MAEILKAIPEDVRNVLVTAAGGELKDDSYEITSQQHTKMSLAFQSYNRSANSKTNNLPSSSTVEDLRDAWIDALAGDPVSAFGGILITNKEIDEETAFEINNLFFLQHLNHQLP